MSCTVWSMLTMLFVLVSFFFFASLLENSIYPLLLLNGVFPLHIFIRTERICIRLSIDLSLNWQFFCCCCCCCWYYFLNQSWYHSLSIRSCGVSSPSRWILSLLKWQNGLPNHQNIRKLLAFYTLEIELQFRSSCMSSWKIQ